MENRSRYFGPFGGKGLSVWLVGGALRDISLGMEPRDLDLVVDLPIEEIAALSDGAIVGPAGMQICVLSWDEFVMEVCPLRGGSIEADLSVRDFTVNAMALGENGVLIDPFGGKSDLVSETLRFVGKTWDRLEEDPIRALRMCRFASSLGFTPSSGAVDSVGDFVARRSDRIRILPAPRIGKEMVAGLVRPLPFLASMAKVGLSGLLLPSLDSGLASDIFSVLSESRGEDLPLEMALAVIAGASICDDSESDPRRWIAWGVGRSIRRKADILRRFPSIDPDMTMADMGELIWEHGRDHVLSLFELSAAYGTCLSGKKGELWRESLSRLDKATDNMDRAFLSGIVPGGEDVRDLVGEGPRVGRSMSVLYRALASGECTTLEDVLNSIQDAQAAPEKEG